MTTKDSRALRPGHPSRRTSALALRAAVVNAVAFTVFAVVTTQAKGVRAGSPWQDDPYDGVVSFTMFLVPTLTLLMVVRTRLCRRDQPLAWFRVHQLLRAATVTTSLIALTIAADWVAVAVRAHHASTNGTTGWLVTALATLTGTSLVAALLRQRVHLAAPQPGRGSGRNLHEDWLEDAVILVDAVVNAVAARYPRLGRALTARVRPKVLAAFVRGHLTAMAAAASLAGALLVVTPLAVGERWTDPWLFGFCTVLYSCGLFAVCMISNALLVISITERKPHRRSRPDSRARHAARVATVGGLLAAQLAMALRDSIWTALGHHAPVDTVGQAAALTATVGVIAMALIFVARLAVKGPDARRR